MRSVLRMSSVAALVALAGCGAEEPPSLVPAPSRAEWAPEGAWPGFTLVSPNRTKRVYLVDMAGEAVHHWDAVSRPGEAIYLTARGTLLRCMRVPDHPTFQDTGGNGGHIQEIDFDGTVLWNFHWDSEAGLAHHDIEEMPNGNILMIAWDRTTREVALAAGRDPELLEGEEWWPGAVYEIRPTRPEGGEVVWSWHAIDHLIQEFDPRLPNFGDPRVRPERIDINGDRDPEPPTEAEEEEEAEMLAALGYAGGDDDPPPADDHKDDDESEDDPEKAARKARVKDADWMHTNAVAYHAGFDQIAISVRRFDEIWVIDHNTTTQQAKGPAGDLLYRWGNPFAYGMGPYEDRPLRGQHNVQWIPEGYLGAGNLIVFNNGTRDDEYSTILEWRAPHTADGRYWRKKVEPFGPTEVEWSYEAETREDFFSPFISGVQRLPNGNTLICSGAPGHIFEVTPAGDVVWDWKQPFVARPGDLTEKQMEEKRYTTALFRAERYAPDYPGIQALRDKGVAIPLDPGTGPATNQYVPPPDEEDEADTE